MAIENTSTFRVEGAFSQGFMDSIRRNQIPPQFTPRQRNTRLNGLGTTIRPGFVQKGADITVGSGTFPKGMASYLRQSARLAASTIAFVDSNPDTITDSGSAFLTSGFAAGQTIRVSGSASNNGVFTIATVVAGTITLIAGDSLAVESAGASVIITSADTAGVLDKLIANYDTTLWEFNDSTDVWDEISAADAKINADVKMNFTGHQDVMMCMNGIDDLFVLSGSAVITPTMSTDFAPEFSVIFTEQQWISGWSTNPNVLYVSRTATLANPAFIYDFTGAGSDQIIFRHRLTGLAIILEALYVFTVKGIEMLDKAGFKEVGSALVPVFTPVTQGEGSVNHRSVVTVDNAVFYLTPTNKIKTINFGAGNSTITLAGELSHRVENGIPNFMGTLDEDQSDSFGIWIEKDNLIQWHVKTKNSSVNDAVINYDVVRDTFLIDDDKYFFHGVEHNGEIFMASMFNNKVYNDNTGFDDDGEGIAFSYDTADFDLGDPLTRRQLREIRLFGEGNELMDISCQVFVDGFESMDAVTIDNNDLGGQVGGGIGDQDIGDNAIGEGGEEPIEPVEFVKIISKSRLRAKGRKFKLTLSGTTKGAEFTFSALDYTVRQLDRDSGQLSEKN